MAENQNIRISRRGQLWFWELHERGETYSGERGQPTADLAAQEAQMRHGHLNLMRHFQKQRAEI